MSALGKYKVIVITVFGILCLVTSGSTGAPMPEFGDSVQFDKSGPDIRMSQLKGKAVLVIFFQSWCGICNGWSPELIKQVEGAHGNNRSLVMMAIKTDGGGISGARNYFKSAGADLDKWCVGIDKNATFYKQVTGKDELWGYVLVGANGNIVKHGKAGSYRPVAHNKIKYVLSSGNLLKGCGKLETVLPPNKEYPPELSKITRLAELGCLSKALSLCAPSRQSSKNKAAAEALKQDILSIVETRIGNRVDILSDTNKDAGSRYEAHKELSVMVKEFRTVPAAKEANVLLAKTRRDPVIQKEKNAETVYLRAMQKLQKASKRDQPRILRELQMVAKKYEGTKYGKLAAEESQVGVQ